MPGPVDIVIEGVTSVTPGRFVLSAPHFQIVADGSTGTGGPGAAAGAMHLLAGALATCALNVFRGGIEPELPNPRHAAISVRLARGDSAPRFAIYLDARIDGVSAEEADRLRILYLENCSIYAALKDAIDITVSTRPL